MLEVLANRTYRHLFLAQVIALLGTGLATVALGLLAFDLAGANAGAVLGTALAIKMLAYIAVAPIASALAERLPRRAVLVALDLVRAAVALLLPFVTQIWEIYVLIFVLQSASAAFTPTFQATIPDVLPEERAYTKALSLSRLAYDLESLVSPMLAALLLTVVSYHSLFGGTVLGFLASAALVVSAVLPRAKMPPKRSIYERTTRGVRIYLATPAWPSGPEPGHCLGQRDGHCQHRGAGAGWVWHDADCHGHCTGLLWRRFNAHCLGAAQSARPCARAACHADGRWRDCHWAALGRCAGDALRCAAAALVCPRAGVFTGANALRAAAAPFFRRD